MSRFKRGDIIWNKWAADTNPIRAFVYTHTAGDAVHGIHVNRGLERVRYYKHVAEDIERFEIIGHTDEFDILMRDITAHRVRCTREKEAPHD